MSLKRRVRMGKWNRIFVMSAVLLPTVFLSTNLFSAQIDTGTQALISSNSQSAIQNLSSVSSGDPKSPFRNWKTQKLSRTPQSSKYLLYPTKDKQMNE